LSAISFVGVGAILQPQAFAQEVNQGILQVGENSARAGEDSRIGQAIGQGASNFAAVEDEDDAQVGQAIGQGASNFAEAGEDSEISQGTLQLASNEAVVGEDDD
jgi:hypothetical protein